jgi:hypothetical protein
MKLLAAAAAGLAVCAIYSVLRTEAITSRKLLRQFQCWLCKHPTTYTASVRTKHCDCGFCGISNKLLPGATAGGLPDIQVSLA